MFLLQMSGGDGVGWRREAPCGWDDRRQRMCAVLVGSRLHVTSSLLQLRGWSVSAMFCATINFLLLIVVYCIAFTLTRLRKACFPVRKSLTYTVPYTHDTRSRNCRHSDFYLHNNNKKYIIIIIIIIDFIFWHRFSAPVFVPLYVLNEYLWRR